MRCVCWLLAAAVVSLFPSTSLAQSFSPHGYKPSPSTCGAHHHDDDAASPVRFQCTAGLALNVSSNGMKVRPAHGSPLRVRFSDDTVFETDSGEGVLDGLVSGDYVCVAYKPHTGTVTGLLVIFDPDSLPCGSRRLLALVIGHEGR